MEGPSAGLIPESFALLPFVCDVLKTRVLFFQFYDASKQDDKWGQQLLISSLHEAHPGFYT